MSNKADELRNAINAQIRPAVENLMNELTPSQVHEFLRSKENDKPMLDHVFNISPLDVALILLNKSQNKPQLTGEKNWLEIFDQLEDVLLAPRRKHRNIPTNILASKISFLARWKQLIDLRSLIKRPKFFATALLLGAKFVPQFEFETIFYFVLSNGFKHFKDRKDLIGWLLDHKFITQQDISIKILSQTIQKGSHALADLLLKHFPPLLDAKDPAGCNVIHHGLPNMVPIKSFQRLYKFVEARVTPAKLHEIVLAQSEVGIIPVVEILRETLQIPNTTLPTTILNSAIKLSQERHNVFEKFKTALHARQVWSNTVIKAYLLQNGMQMTLPQFTDRKGIKDLSQMFWFVKAPKMSENKDAEVSTNQSEAKIEISVLPNEILLLIAASLKPADFIRLSITSKNMMDLLLSNGSNEMFWKEYYERNFSGGFWRGPTYKEKFILETRGLNNWRKKASTTILFDTYEPHIMDENWLIMKFNYNTFAYWNCHTQERIHEKKTLPTHVNKPLAILQSYSSGALPPVMFKNFPPSFGENGRKVLIRNGDQETFPKKLHEELGKRSISHANSIDHRVLLSCVLYNAEVDEIIGQGSGPSLSDIRCSLNPHNRTFLVSHDKNMTVYNYQYEKLATFADVAQYQFSVLQVVDEYTLFFQEFSHLLPSGYIDLRTGKKIWEQIDLLPLCYMNRAHAISPTRLITSGGNTELIASYHLPSQKFEWIHANEFLTPNYMRRFAPVAVNNRYLACKFDEKAILYDFCPNA